MDVNQQILVLTADVASIRVQYDTLLKLVNSAISTKTLSNFAAVVNSDIADVSDALEAFETTLSALEQRVIALEQRVLE